MASILILRRLGQWPSQFVHFWINRAVERALKIAARTEGSGVSPWRDKLPSFPQPVARRPKSAARHFRGAWRMTVQCIGPACWPRVQPWQDARPSPDGPPGLVIQRIASGATIPRAQSVESALLLVIDGQLELSSYRGRERLARGALAIRPTFDCRALGGGPGGAAWLQLPWHADWSLGTTRHVADVDDLLSRAGHDPSDAVEEVKRLIAHSPSLPPLRIHWADDLKNALLADPHLSISDWARSQNVSREGAARAFRAAYAVSPARFRLELRARGAWARIVSGDEPLSLIALETGFADQSHMTRAVGWLTGQSPSTWRRKHRAGGAGRFRQKRSAR